MLCLVWAPFADAEQLAALAAVALVIVVYTAFRLAVAFGKVPWRTIPTGTFRVRRIRQQHHLTSRSWLEFVAEGQTHWVPVYFDPGLIPLPESSTDCDTPLTLNAIPIHPSGRARHAEPPGRLHDNPTRPDPEAPAHAAAVAHIPHRLLLDAQSAIAAPFIALFWVYVAGGGITAFIAATTVAAAAAIWLAAINGSDPS
ncbi:MAG: hypothetical protein J2P18_08495 [Nocardia sp.]|nr:hypothetical protein [Nocardia sp.]